MGSSETSSTNSPGAAPAKVCTVCNTDVAHKPRVKDAQGRYYCETCEAKARAQAATPAKAQPAQPPAVQKVAQVSKQVPAQKSAASKQPADGLMLDLLDEPPPANDVILPEGYDASLVLAATKTEQEKPVRAFEMTPKTPDGKGPKGKSFKYSSEPFLCRHCGYDLSGAPSMRCPECGKFNRTPKSDALMEIERETKREMYVRPCWLMGIGLVLSLIVLATGKAGVAEYFLLLTSWVVSTVFGVFTFWACSLMFLEYDAPWHVTLLRLAGIQACVHVGLALGISTGIFVFGYAAFGLLILLYMTELEMEKWEAMTMAVVGAILGFAIKIVIFVVAVRLLASAGVGAGALPGAGAPGTGGPTPAYVDKNLDGYDDDTGEPLPGSGNEPLPGSGPDSGDGGGE